MADSTHDLIYRILVDVVGTEKAEQITAKINEQKAAMTSAVSATGEMTAATGGLATAIPDLSAKTDQFVIETESEYRAIVRAADALQRNITIRKAANLEITEQTERLAALDAALSTESALRVAERMEIRAATLAKTEDTAATIANTSANESQVLMGRKLVSLFDEISRGQRGAMVSTIGSFLKDTGAGLAAMGGGIAAFAGINLLWNYFRKADEALNKLREDQAALDTSVWDSEREGAEKAKTAADEYAQTLQDIAADTDKLKQNEDLRLAVLNATVTAQNKILAAEEKAAIAAAGSDQVKIALVRQQYQDAQSAQALRAEQVRVYLQEQNLKEQQTAAADAKKKSDAANTAYQAALTEPPEVARAKERLKELEGNQGTREKDLMAAVIQSAGLTGVKLPEGQTDLEAASHRLAKMQAAIKNFAAGPGEPWESASMRLALMEQNAHALKISLRALEENQAEIKRNQTVVDAYTSRVTNLKSAASHALGEYRKRQGQEQSTEAELQKSKAVLKINQATAGTVSGIEQESSFKTAVSAEMQPAGTKLTADQKAAIVETQQMFKDAGGNFQALINTLRQFRGTQEQWVREINDEFDLLRQSIEIHSQRAQNHLTP